MTTKRVKREVLKPKSMEEVEKFMSEYAEADARMAKITATMDEQITKIRDKYADELQVLAETKEAAFAAIQIYAESNMEKFEGKKSIDLTHGRIGFRTGTPKLKLRKKFTWGAVTEMLKELLPAYVRTVEEPAKDKLLADRDKEEVFTAMPKCGIEVVQDESFYIELKKEEFATV